MKRRRFPHIFNRLFATFSTSCLPEVLRIVQEPEWLNDNPDLVVASLDVIRALWSGPTAALLRRTPDFWDCILRPLLSPPETDDGWKHNDVLRAKVSRG